MRLDRDMLANLVYAVLIVQIVLFLASNHRCRTDIETRQPRVAKRGALFSGVTRTPPRLVFKLQPCCFDIHARPSDIRRSH
jgi:hypothetical protein